MPIAESVTASSMNRSQAMTDTREMRFFILAGLYAADVAMAIFAIIFVEIIRTEKTFWRAMAATWILTAVIVFSVLRKVYGP